MRRIILVIVLLCSALSHGAETQWVQWSKLPPIPDTVGLAGPFAGVSNGALIVAGGSNFPQSPPWEGGTKAWHDRIYVLPKPDGQWQLLDERLPRPIACGVSVTTRKGIVWIGGGDADHHYADVYRVQWKDGKLTREDLAPLPAPLAHMAGALVGETIYIAGGSEFPTATEGTTHFFALDLSKPDAKWQTLADCPGPKRVAAVGGSQDKSFFVFSGARLFPGPDGKPGREYLTDAYRYSPDTGWRKLADMPRPALAAPTPAAPVGPGHLLIFGGDDGTSFTLAQKDHRGFARDVIAYHTITNTWATVGTLDAPRAVAPLVPWAGGFIIPNGEIRAGVRSPEVQLAKVEIPKPGFGILNYITLGLYPLVMLAISYFVGKKNTSDEFFRGGQRIPWWAAGISIYATMLSSITYMAVPAKAYAADWSYLIKAIGFIAITPIVAYVYLPFFRQLNVTSAYEYLEKRFNLAARWFGSASFMILQLGRTAIVLYLPSLALATVTQFDIVTCILLMGAISILMTFLGGVEAVVWTDVAQTVIFLAGIGITLICLMSRSNLSPGEMVHLASTDGKLFGNMTWDWSWVAATASVILIGDFFANLIPYTASQDVVQRYLTTKDQKQAARAIFTNAALTVPFSVLFFAMGTALYVFYKNLPQRLDPHITTDQIFPLFMIRELPAGVAGLVVAGIFAAAQPTSNLNSMATAFVTDFYKRTRPEASDLKILRLAQQLTVLFGIMGTGVALLIVLLRIESIWDLFLQMIGLTGASLAGLFALGIFTRRANGRGALVGAVASVIVLFYVQRFTKVNFFLYSAIGIFTCALVGYLASLILPGEQKPLEGLTVYTTRRGAETSSHPLDSATIAPAR